MEKVLYVLWDPPPVAELADALQGPDPRGLQLNLVDEAVIPAWGGALEVEDPPMEGMAWPSCADLSASDPTNSSGCGRRSRRPWPSRPRARSATSRTWSSAP